MIVSGQENEGYAAIDESVRNRKGHLALKVEVDYSAVELFGLAHKVKGRIYACCGPDDFGAIGAQSLSQFGREKVLVLDNEKPAAG